MRRIEHRLRAVMLVCLSAFIFSHAAVAADKDKSLAEAKVVLQISDNDPSKQTLVLNVANNLVKAYSGNVDIEIVAFGPGLRLLFADNHNADRIQGLVGSGVKFSACGNTKTNMAKLLGQEPQLNGNATVVPAGIVRIVELVDQGYTLVKP